MASQFLYLPISNENSEEINSSSPRVCPIEEINSFFLYSLKKPYNLKHVKHVHNLKHIRCLGGSSDGWLSFLDEKGDPFLVNIFSGSRISLPPSKNNSTILKLVRSSHVVVIISELGLKSSISFCREGDENWRDLDCIDGEYYDVVLCDKTSMLYALAEGPRVESWDLAQTTPKKMIIDRA